MSLVPVVTLMFPFTKRQRFVVRLILAVAAVIVGFVSRNTPKDSFRPFIPRTLPVRAIGDFDGDGRADTALVQDSGGDHRIWVQLSASSSSVRLEAAVTGVIEGDIDHDGDLDLVAATASGEVLIWLNDGRGRFTRQPTVRAGGLSGEPIIMQVVWPESLAVGLRPPVIPSPARTRAAVLVTKARPPTADVDLYASAPILPALRAPPLSI